MRYRYLDDLRRRTSVFAIFSYGIGNPPMSLSWLPTVRRHFFSLSVSIVL